MQKNRNRTIRIGGGQGFWGDWLLAPERLVRACVKESKPLDYLVLDYLAEVTMSILAKQKGRSPDHGYAKDFPQLISSLYPEIIHQKHPLKVIANAGGLSPESCAKACQILLSARADFTRMPVIAIIGGDNLYPYVEDLMDKGENFSHLENGKSISEVLPELKSMNAYIGAGCIVDALAKGAEIIITGRVADPCLALGALMHEFSWRRDDWDLLASGIVAGHVIECGAQSTGGNFSAAWDKVPEPWDIGFPVVECSGSGEIVVTKPQGTGGIVDRRSVTEQLVYEIGDPAAYYTPDVIVDFTSIEISEITENQVKLTNIKGAPKPEKLKVSASYFDGYMTEGTLLLVGPKVKEKARICEDIIRHRLTMAGITYDELLFEYLGAFSCIPGMAEKLSYPEPGEIVFRAALRSKNKEHVGRFAREIAPLVLGGPSGITGYASGKRDVREIFAYWPTLVKREFVKESWRLV